MVWGPETDSISKISAGDGRISLKGIVSREAALDKMRKCDILLNPRLLGTDMEKNSFPSKIFDYALAERPIMTTRLASLSDSARRFIFEYDSQDRNSAHSVLANIIRMTTEEREEIGAEFSRCMYNECSAIALGKKIKMLLEGSMS